MVIGPVAPSEGAGSEWNGMPASAITMMAAVTFSVKISGLTGETASVRHGRWRSASDPARAGRRHLDDDAGVVAGSRQPRRRPACGCCAA